MASGGGGVASGGQTHSKQMTHIGVHRSSRCVGVCLAAGGRKGNPWECISGRNEQKMSENNENQKSQVSDAVKRASVRKALSFSRALRCSRNKIRGELYQALLNHPHRRTIKHRPKNCEVY